MIKQDNTAGGMRIFVFKSEGREGLHAFAGDLAGFRLPAQFKPWSATGSIAPDGNFPYKNLSRDAIETAIRDQGYLLYRFKRNPNDNNDN
jgi:hypothetical protein